MISEVQFVDLCECAQDMTEWDSTDNGYVHAGGCGKTVIPKPAFDRPYLCGSCDLPTARIIAGKCVPCSTTEKEPF